MFTSLNPDQDRQHVGPDLGPNGLQMFTRTQLKLLLLNAI